tara:strand:+ start:21675 stop:22451 length:777 start_codon:yes stop_codon:yes gene_type:complete
MYSEELAVIEDAVLTAGDLLKSYFGKISSFHEKSDSSLVSKADQEAEEIIFQKLKAAFPKAEFYGEEGGKREGLQGFERSFACDPLDGTTNFLYRIPYFCSSVAMAYQGEWVLGYIYNPISGDVFYAIKGEGAFHNGKAMQASKLEDESKAMVVFSRAFSSNYGRAIIPLYKRLQNVRAVRSMGSAALDLAYVADGRFDLHLCKGLNVWDTAAATVMLRESGAAVMDLQGSDYDPFYADILAGSPALVEKYLDLVKGL